MKTTINNGINWELQEINSGWLINPLDKSSISGEVTIPAEHNGIPVTAINYEAFSGCTGLNSVTIPNSVERICGYAFKDCINLNSITIPDSVTVIEEYAFFKCEGLKSIEIPEGIEYIGDYAFAECHGLTSVTMPNKGYVLCEKAFKGSEGLLLDEEDINTNEKLIKLVFSYEGINNIPYEERTTEYFGDYSEYSVKNGKTITPQLFNKAFNALDITPNQLDEFISGRDFDKALVANLLKNEKIVNMIFSYETICKLPNGERITENVSDKGIRIKTNQSFDKLRSNLHSASVVINKSIPEYLVNPKFDNIKEVQKEMKYNLKNNKKINTYMPLVSKNYERKQPTPNNTEPQELNFNKQPNEPILPNQINGGGMTQTM